ncbi:hypothetical protein [Peptostreptococcus faecalis]|uniref:hypothetical protein n=1 Tax=Peptostreptococcus faecalis TaxID=2045015 RepID=UPI0011AEF155|nr:hypothetical protein [Peptostreptococcus faecalis]
MLTLYLTELLQREYNLKFSERQMKKILDGMEYGIKTLIEDGYSFKLLDTNYEPYVKKPVIYKEIRSGEIKKSDARFDVRTYMSRSYRKELGKKTKHKTNEEPRVIGLYESEVPKNLK